MKFLKVLLMLLTPIASHAQDSLCSDKNIVTLESVESVTQQLIHSHPEFDILRNAIIEIKPIENDKETFFKTFFSVSSRLRLDKEPIYRIFVNEGINECAPSYEATEAILSHELFHIKDYAERSNLGLIELGIIYLTKGAKYERATDLKSVHLGYGEGLIGYRRWIYSLLDEKGLKKKIRYYLTPEEIEEIMNENLNAPKP